MEPGSSRDGAFATAERALTEMSDRACPSLTEALAVVASAWHFVDDDAVDERLDELARPLFAVGPEGIGRAAALARVVNGGFEVEIDTAAGLWLDAVLETRRGHPVLLTALAAELGRRAGWEVSICSSPTGWYAGLLDDERLWLVDATGEGSGGAPAQVRRHCTHELAFVVLTGLAERLADPDDTARARTLGGCLARFAPPEDPGPSLLGVLWSGSGSPR